MFFPHHHLNCVKSYISELLDNLREAANSDTPNVIQHNRWVDQFVAICAQLEVDKEKEETEKRFPRCDQASQEIESAKKLRLLEKNEQHAIFQMKKDKETHGLSVLDCLALTFSKPSWFELMLWLGTYMTDKDTGLVDCQTRVEVQKVINKIVGKTESVSLLTSDHADSLSKSLRPHLKNDEFML